MVKTSYNNRRDDFNTATNVSTARTTMPTVLLLGSHTSRVTPTVLNLWYWTTSTRVALTNVHKVEKAATRETTVKETTIV
jgi:hypothetical protein